LADLYEPFNQNQSAKFIIENTAYYCSKKDLKEKNHTVCEGWANDMRRQHNEVTGNM